MLLLCVTALILSPAWAAANDTLTPVLWRQLNPASATTEAMFKHRSPQFVMYHNGLIVYRDDRLSVPYKQVRLTREEYLAFLSFLQAEFKVSGLTPKRLEEETPAIRSLQKPIRSRDETRVTIWLGLYEKPALLREKVTVLEARDGNTFLAPAWEALNRLNRYLASFQHPRAKPFIPDRVEIAVQALPDRLDGKADAAEPWPLPEVALDRIKGDRLRGFRTLSGEQARIAYTLLSEHPIVKDAGTLYMAWVRPILLPERR